MLQTLIGVESCMFWKQLATKITYGGNPEHKRNPGDFGLQPPSQPRQGKTLCDEAEIFTRRDAQSLLRKALAAVWSVGKNVVVGRRTSGL